MGNETEISWTDATFNGWEGCQKVGPGCENCYAETRNARYGGGVAMNWGPGAPRRRTSVQNWNLPKRWNARPFYECKACGHRGEGVAFDTFVGNPRVKVGEGRECEKCPSQDLAPARRRVFCSSLADVFDNEVDPQWRADLFALIRATPNLDWLLLTKRIGNAHRMMTEAMIELNRDGDIAMPLSNLWLGATIVNQEEADRDIPKLLEVPAAKRFLSMEPLLGAVDIRKWLDPWTCSDCQFHGAEGDGGPCMCKDCDIEAIYAADIGSARCPSCGKNDGQSSDTVGDSCPSCGSVSGWSRDNGFKFESGQTLIDWVIVGGESGKGARPMDLAWVRSLRDQCEAAGVAYHLKQITDDKGKKTAMETWPADLQNRQEFPRITP